MANKAIESNLFRIYSAQKFLEGLFQTQLSTNNLYVYIGKTTPWTSDSNPDQPNDTVASRGALFPNMLAIKKVSPSDVILVIPSFPWASGTVYSQYVSTGAEVGGIYYDQFEPTLSIEPFYVINTSNNVYKCLGNNSGGPSTVMPTSTGTTPVTLVDGYIWKFMFQVSTENAQKFLSNADSTSSGYIPIYTLQNNDGSLQWAVQATASPTDGSGLPGGHGSDPVNELGAMYAMVDVDFNYDESGKITISNAYREFGLLLNPLTYGSVIPFTALVGVGTTNIPISSVSGSFNVDDLVTGQTSGATGFVVDYNTLPGIIRLTQVVGTFMVGETIMDNTSSATAISGTPVHPDFSPNTGLVLSEENMSPLTRALAQIEDIKIVIPF
jgi:hypothetical protein